MAGSHAITRVVLRTTDAPSARAFYSALLGQGRLSIVPLHEQALARGARPHPVGTFPDGRQFAVLRDPGGAIIGLTSPGAHDGPQVVVWHQLNTNDRPRVEQAYATLFSWRLTQLVNHPEHGELQHFGWPETDADAGAIFDIRGRAGRYPHWLFHLRVVDLDRAIAVVRESGGVALGPFKLPDGERLAVCDDPQGAAFALRG